MSAICSRSLRLAAALVALLALSACSVAGLPAFAPGHKSPKTASLDRAPQPAQRPAEAAPEPFVALAYADPTPRAAPSSSSRGALDGLIGKYARHYNVPESLVHRVVKRESTYNPAARNGPYYGLMQISHATARSMGYKGSPAGLLDADTNLKYAVKYLAGAYIVGGRNQDQAVRLYSRGYYYDAKRQGLLETVGLR